MDAFICFMVEVFNKSSPNSQSFSCLIYLQHFDCVCFVQVLTLGFHKLSLEQFTVSWCSSLIHEKDKCLNPKSLHYFVYVDVTFFKCEFVLWYIDSSQCLEYLCPPDYVTWTLLNMRSHVDTTLCGHGYDTWVGSFQCSLDCLV